MKSAAAIVLGLAATACSNDFDVVEKVEQQSIDNAQQTLGFYIPENQDWKMTSNATANFSVAGASDETYTVKIYSNNLFEDGIGYIITKKNVQGGQNFTAEFAYPAFQKSLYVGLTDSKGRTTYKIADIVDGKLTSLNDVSAARTRATPSESYQNGYSGAYPDANEWAMRGYTVPPELTEGQKLRVQYYFQTVKITDPNRPKNGNMDFFIQQVYDGATDPITQYSGYSSPTYSTEVYKAADNINYIESGKHMDHLTAGEGTDRRHIYNFNNSTYGTNGAPNRDVQNSEGVTYHSTGNAEGYHADQIQLMLNTNTDCFGYGNSDDSYVRDDRWTLVSWETIESYCNNPANGYEAWRSTNHSNIPDASLNDGWGRSFIGFDFDMLPDEYILAGDFEWDYSQNPAKITNVKSWTYFSIWLGDKDEVWNGTRLVKANTLGEVVAENGGYRFYPYMPGTTKKVNTVNANKNEYCGSSEEWTDNDWKYYDENGNDTGYKSIVKMKKALEDEKLPTSSSDKTWVTIGNCADDYYSDWIVSFLPADPNQTIIIIEEEKETYTYAFEDNKTTCDFDLNDVVIWVKENENDDTKIDITLVAAGCEFDNYVFLGTTRIEWPKGAEVHDALGIAKGVMFNTKSNTVDPSTFVTTTIDKPQGFNIEQADFRIMPYAKGSDFNDATARKEKDGDGYIRTSALVTMERETATAPIGLVFPCKWHWPKERVIVSNAYDNFTQWGSLPDAKVRATVSDWYKSPVSGQVVTWVTTNE